MKGNLSTTTIKKTYIVKNVYRKYWSSYTAHKSYESAAITADIRGARRRQRTSQVPYASFTPKLFTRKSLITQNNSNVLQKEPPEQHT